MAVVEDESGIVININEKITTICKCGLLFPETSINDIIFTLGLSQSPEIYIYLSLILDSFLGQMINCTS